MISSIWLDSLNFSHCGCADFDFSFGALHCFLISCSTTFCFVCFLCSAPSIVSVIASNTGSPSAYGVGDSITITFDTSTNKAGDGNSISSAAAVNALFLPSMNLGQSYTGYWADAAHFIITILDPTNAAPPQIGVLYFTVATAIRSVYSDSNVNPALTVGITTPVISGSFAYPPVISSVVASGFETSFSSSCNLTVHFDLPTNTPALAPTALFQFTSSITDFTSSSGSWITSSSYLITNPTASSLPAIGQSGFLSVRPAAALRNIYATSDVSTASAPALTGSFTQGSC